MDKEKIVILTEDEKNIRARLGRNIVEEVDFPDGVYSYQK